MLQFAHLLCVEIFSQRSGFTMHRIIIHSVGEKKTVQIKVVLDGNNLGFFVNMINRNHLNAAGGDTKGGVLESLKFLD